MIKIHFSLSESGITNESDNVWGTHPQSGYEHAEEVANICSGFRGTYWLPWELAISPSPLPFGIYFPILGIPSLLPKGPLDFSGATSSGLQLPLSGMILFGELICFKQLGVVQVSNISGQFYLGCECLGLQSSFFWSKNIRERPDCVFIYQMSDCLLQWYILLPAYPSEIEHGVYLVHSARPWPHWDGTLWPSCQIHT